jgi:hypothetical protein
MAILEAMGLVRKRINRRYRTVRREGNFLPGTLGQGRARGGPGEGQGGSACPLCPLGRRDSYKSAVAGGSAGVGPLSDIGAQYHSTR